MSVVGITVEGGIFPADLFQTIQAAPEEVQGQRAADFSLDGVRMSEEIQDTFSIVRTQWQRFARRREAVGDAASGVTRADWIVPFLGELGWTLQYQRAALTRGGASFTISHLAGESEGAPPVHIVAFDRALDERGKDRQRSPHALVQEFLNRDDSLWGLVTNGRKLRLLRNTQRFTKPTYVEFDLEAIVEGNLYSEFLLVYRVLHRTRFPEGAGDADQCLLERWYQQGIEEGGRVRERLRDGVEAALKAFGTGFLAHPDSDELRDAVERDRLPALDLYRELLHLVYRLLFLMVAEERKLLFLDDPEKRERQEIYTRWYSIERLRARAEARHGDDPYPDLWQGLIQTFRLFREERHAQKLGLGVLDGELFGGPACRFLERAQIRNDVLLDAIFQLSTFEETVGRKRGGRRRVAFSHLDVEELGSVYESLLDFRPDISLAPARFDLLSGTERKSTGSYYTPKELVAELIKSALEPIVEARLAAAKTPGDKERALLDLRVCDPAAGSGHFLLAAARRLGRELARVRTGEAEPPPSHYRRAVRDVVRHCLYAVDRNPLAVDLCKVSLWIEGHDPGLPLSFLDHHIRLGDSLVGIFDTKVLEKGLPDAAYKALTGDDKDVARDLRRRNQEERDGQQSLDLFDTPDLVAAGRSLALAFGELDAFEDDSPATVAEKERRYHQYRELLPEFRRLREAADLWTAAFFTPLRKPKAGEPERVPTTDHVIRALRGRQGIQAVMKTALELADANRFFHWPLEFPDVMAKGGFDVMLGNPPWEVSQFAEIEFFSSRDARIANLKGEKRKQAITALPEDNPALWERFVEAKREFEAANEFYGSSGRFPLTTYGKLNTYALFAEDFLQLINKNGRAGFIVPTGIATDSSTKSFFDHVANRRQLASLLAFENEEFIFRAVHHAFRFCLLTLGGAARGETGTFVFFARQPAQVHDERRRFKLTPEDIALLNPNTRTCPVFRTDYDAELTKKIYRRVPVLIDDSKGEVGNPWGIMFRQGLFNMTSDSSLFRRHEQLEKAGGTFDAPAWTLPSGERWLPLYEAKMIHHFDHRWATYGADGESVRDASAAEKQDPAFRPMPRYWIPEREVYLHTANLPKGLLAALRDQDARLTVLGLAHLLFGPWLRQVAGQTVAGAMGKLLPAWRNFVATHLFAREVAPTQLGLCGNNPPCLTPGGPEYLPAQPVDAIENNGRTQTAWYAADKDAVAIYLRFAAGNTRLAESAPRLTNEAEALAYAEECLKQASPRWLLGWRDITGIEKIRTVIASALPLAAVGHTMPLFFLDDVAPELRAAFQANMSSLVLDQQARLKVGGTHLTYGYLKQLPVLTPSAYTSTDLDFIVPRVLELTYTSWDMQPFAKDLGYDGPPFRWDPERRAVLRAELDAYYAYLYALTREELCYILDPKAVKGEDFPSETFRVLKNNEISKHGEYLTQRLVLEAFDRFASNGTFDPAKLQDPIYFPALQKAYAEKSRAYAELRATHRDLLARADQQAKPVLFVEGRSDVPVIEAAWSVFLPGQPMPFAVLAAGGTTQMGSLAGKGKALRDVLGDRLVCALADNDGDGRRLWDNGLFRKGGVWRLHPNGIWWCLLQPRGDFRVIMERFGVPEASFPFSIEAAFPASVRRQAMAEGAYIPSDEPQTDLTQEPAPVKKLFAEIPKLAPNDDARLELLAPDPTCKEPFAAWITAPERRTREVYAAFEGIMHGLSDLMDKHARGELNPPQRPAAE